MTTKHEHVTVSRIDYQSSHETRNPWIECPVCEQEHPTEFVWTGEHWLGFCREGAQLLVATFEEETS